MAGPPPRPKAPREPSEETTEVMSVPATDVTLADLHAEEPADEPAEAEAAEVDDPNKAYVAPRKIPQAKLPSADDGKRIVLNLPDQSAILAPSATDVDRARRRAATVKVARGTLAAQQEDGVKEAAAALAEEALADKEAQAASGASATLIPAVAVPKAPARPLKSASTSGAPPVNGQAEGTEQPVGARAAQEPARPTETPSKNPRPRRVSERESPNSSLVNRSDTPSAYVERAYVERAYVESAYVESEAPPAPKSVWPKALVALMVAAGVGGVVVGLRSPAGPAPAAAPSASAPTLSDTQGESPKTAEPGGAALQAPIAEPSGEPSAEPSGGPSGGPSAEPIAEPTATALDLGQVAVNQPPPTPAPQPPATTPPARPYTPPTTGNTTPGGPTPGGPKPTGAKPGGPAGGNTGKTDVPSSI